MNETNIIASRRKFLTRMAYGSLLAISGSGIAEAAVKHAVHSNKKADVKHTAKQHLETHSNKHTLHEKVALKTSNSHHSAHQQLASKGNDSRIHSSLHKDPNGGHRLHHDDVRDRLALQNNNRIIQQAVRERNNPIHRNMPEFAAHDDFELEFHGKSDMGGQDRFSMPPRFASNNNSIPPRFVGNNNVAHKTLALQNTTTGDSLSVTYFEKGRYLPDALDEINYIYRDHLTDEVHPVDVALLDQLHDLQSTLGVKRQIHVICGYRSPFTNAHLRRNSRGVARNSLHMQGRAIDIRIAGVESRNIRDAALSMARGGVGYYPGSNFVHLDTGDFRTW
jgi:uncharacterized protein YcbK (DUF882 family)